MPYGLGLSEGAVSTFSYLLAGAANGLRVVSIGRCPTAASAAPHTAVGTVATAGRGATSATSITKREWWVRRWTRLLHTALTNHTACGIM